MNIVVLGDIMMDINHKSITTRSAAEADLPVYKVLETNYILGGAGNVAKNLKNLKTNVEIICVLGNDNYGKKIDNTLKELGIKNMCYFDSSRKTTQKNRLFCDEKLVSRFDIEDSHDIDVNMESSIFNYIDKKINSINAFIISDYNKGVVTASLCNKIINLCKNHNIPTFIDPKFTNIHKYKNCFCFKPNLKEAETISGSTNLDKVFEDIKNIINPVNLVITSSRDGMFLNNSTNQIKHKSEIPVIDVTGAGDIALCIIVYIYIKSKNMKLACEIANFICGKSVQTIGNYQLVLQDIYDFYLQNKIIYDYESEKISYLSSLKDNNKIVFTNGCFDIVHSAHLKLLKFCKKQGDLLIVGLNSDSSIKKLKGESRPINLVEERADFLLQTSYVDYVIIFDTETPYEIINTLKPNILVKGGDYKIEDVIGRKFVDKVILFDFIKDRSTSLVVKKILDSNEK